jgi:hypothetical protein
MSCTKQWFNTGRPAIVDSGLVRGHLARGFAENGMYVIGTLQSGHSKFPRHRLLSKAKERGQHAR